MLSTRLAPRTACVTVTHRRHRRPLQPPTAAARPWPATTAALVRLSTPLYTLLGAPQLWHNAALLHANKGHRDALTALSPAAFAAAAVGNTALLLHFADTDEPGARLVQAIGAATNAAIVWQLTADATARASVAVAAAITAATVAARSARALPPGVWSLARQVVCLAAASGFAVAGASALGADARAGLAAAGGAAYVATHASVSTHGRPPLAWAATALFAIAPAAALAAAVAAGPAAAALGLATPSLLLAAAANGLCAPRALHVRDAAWTAGSAWGAASALALAATAAAGGGGGSRALVATVAAGVAGLWAAAASREVAWRREEQGAK